MTPLEIIQYELGDSPGCSELQPCVISFFFDVTITAVMAVIMVIVAKRVRATINQYRRMSARNSVGGILWCVERTLKLAEVSSFTDSVCECAPGAVEVAFGCCGSEAGKDLIGEEWGEELPELKDDLLSACFPFSKVEALYEVKTGGAAGLDLLQNMVGRSVVGRR